MRLGVLEGERSGEEEGRGEEKVDRDPSKRAVDRAGSSGGVLLQCCYSAVTVIRVSVL
jgi:hypothetical protein